MFSCLCSWSFTLCQRFMFQFEQNPPVNTALEMLWIFHTPFVLFFIINHLHLLSVGNIPNLITIEHYIYIYCMYKNKIDRHCPMKSVSVRCLRKEREGDALDCNTQEMDHENLLFNGPSDWPVLDVEISIIRIKLPQFHHLFWSSSSSSPPLFWAVPLRC